MGSFDILILIAVGAAVVLAVLFIRRSKGGCSGCSGCSGNCQGCRHKDKGGQSNEQK